MIAASDPGLSRVLDVADTARARPRVRRVQCVVEDAAPALPLLGLVRGVYSTVSGLLAERGCDVEACERMALRASRLTLLLALGFRQCECAGVLGVNVRTVERDRRLLRGVRYDVLEVTAWPRVPTPGNRVEVAL
jgi:hypothetical protein